MTGVKTNSGENLRREWQIPAVDVRYHKDGKWFMPLERFPGALCDRFGYVLFPTRSEYASCKYLNHGKRVNVRDGISRLPRYLRKLEKP